MIFYEGHKVYMNGKYPAICLNGKNAHVHRLEWEKYNGEIQKNCVIHHKDGNKLNWDINNLELLTRSEHIKEHKDTIHRKGVKVIGIKNGKSITFESIEKAAKFCKTYPASIQRIFKGKQKTANGWTFKRI